MLVFSLVWFSILLESKDMSILSSDISQRTQHVGSLPSESALTSVDSDVEHSGLMPVPHSFLRAVRKWGGKVSTTAL